MDPSRWRTPPLCGGMRADPNGLSAFFDIVNGSWRQGLPNGCSDMAIAQRLIVEVVDCHHLPVSALNATWVAEIGATAVAADFNFVVPSSAAIGAQSGPNAKWFGAE